MQGIAKQIYDYGMLAVSSGNYQAAIDYFTTVLEQEDDWNCRWYLAFCYSRANYVNAARHQLTYIAEKCPVESIRKKAQVELKLICQDESSSRASTPPEWFDLLRELDLKHTG